MKFGVRLPNSGPLANKRNILSVAEDADTLGYHSVWVHDHILWGTEQHKTHLSAGSAEALSESQKPNFYESVTTLSFVAARTTNVELGISVLVLPLRNPVVLAKQLSILDVLSEGRLLLGVAPGAPVITQHEFAAVGASYEERGKVTDEFISILRKIWTEKLPSHSGEFASFKEIQMFPKPVRNPPLILIGGGERKISPRALRRVIELGDGWIPAYLTPEEAEEGIKKVAEGLEREGRVVAPPKPLIVHEMFTLIDPDSSNARRLAAKSLSTNFVSVEEGIKRSLVGSPEEIGEKLRRYSAAGVDVTELKFIYQDMRSLSRMMELFRERVMPEFQ
jgi:probable F420-dependent oxidoreductase